MRVGLGFDAHRFEEGRPLRLGGVLVDYRLGLAGHSDADAVLHAIIDALFGAASLGDIGEHFPDTDPRFKDISSLKLLDTAAAMVTNQGFEVVNVDTVIILEEPKIAPYREKMQKTIAERLGIEPARVGVKAKTTEGMGFTGAMEGIAALATVLLDKKR